MTPLRLSIAGLFVLPALACALAIPQRAASGADNPAAAGQDADPPAAAEGAAPAAAADDTMLLYAEPFDEVTLNDEKNTSLKTFPIDLPNRRVPKAPNPADEIEIRLKDHPDQSFKVQWKSIKKITLFEQMLMAEAASLLAEGRFDAAYEHYDYLEDNYPQTAGVKEAIEEYLWSDATRASREGQQDQALALLVELHRRNPRRAGLADRYATVTGRMVDESLKQKNYRAARGLLRNLATLYPDASAETVKKYDEMLKQRALALKAKAESQLKAGQTAQAWRSAAALLDIRPSLPGGAELARKIHAQYSTVVIGVAELPPANEPTLAVVQSLDDWAARRGNRLRLRGLTENRGPGATGGEYQAPLGSLERRPQIGLRLRASRPGVRGLTAADVADALARRANPQSAAYDPAFAQMFLSARVEGLDALTIDFRSLAATPEGWLTNISDAVAARDALTPAIPYNLAGTDLREARYTSNPRYALREPTQPREIVERVYPDTTAALIALRSGQVGVVERMSPWDVSPARAGDDLVVLPYVFPTVHLLVPNQRQPRMANRMFRRAIEYAIDRQAILGRALLAGRQVAGSQVISGPFPRGGEDDPHGYAYNIKVQPRPYDPNLAKLLLNLARAEISAAASPAPDNPAPNKPAGAPLVLAHPPEPAARVACLSIQRQLQAVDVPVTLREIAAGAQPDADFDLAYVELSMQEPAVDVWRLFGPGGLAASGSPYLGQALADLSVAADWSHVCRRLQAIHQLVYEEADVIALWQVVEHLAYLPSVAGIGEHPVSLYDNVEQWKIELRIPSE